MQIKDRLRILRLCSGLGASDDNRDNDDDDDSDNIQPGLPVLPQMASSSYFELLGAWLGRCDQSHNCSKCKEGTNTTLPTRVIYVGDPNPDILVLLCSAELDASSDRRYIALSYCWGNLESGAENRFCTNSQNLHHRLKSFSIKELPKTLQDAVRVTQNLGVQFLWIDSLCILQDKDKKDWEPEVPRMEDVFASAYCTMAATSATNSSGGFLERHSESRFIQVQDGPGRMLYVCEDVEDFDNDVENAVLKTRGWVLQERVLSRRTIHLSKNQTYWECGEGVHCENLTRLESPSLGYKRYFLLDPEFPDRLLQSGYRRTVDFIHFLFEHYSKRDLTYKTDKVVAISALEARIARTLKCEKRYGIFERFLHQTLLWQSPGKEKMERIDYKIQDVLSWSWMAYNGGLKFVDIPFFTAGWIKHLRFDEMRKNALVTEVGRFWDCRMKQKATQCAILDSEGTKIGSLQYDVEGGADIHFHRYVVVGRRRGEYYILVVKPRIMGDEYERIGVGMIHANYVSRERVDVRDRKSVV